MNPKASRQHQTDEWDGIDCGLYGIPFFPNALRGPAQVDPSPPHGVLLVAAQIFGVKIADFYAHHLCSDTKMPWRNHAVRDASLGRCLNHLAALEAFNPAGICVVQVLNPWGTEDNCLESRNGKHMQRSHGSDQRLAHGYSAFWAVFAHKPPVITQLAISEVRPVWPLRMSRLIGAVHLPKIMFWFSKRTLDLPMQFTTTGQAAGVFVQLVTRDMMETVAPFWDCGVEAITRHRMHRRKQNRFTDGAAVSLPGDAGTPWSDDNCNPKPDRHADMQTSFRPVQKAFPREDATYRRLSGDVWPYAKRFLSKHRDQFGLLPTHTFPLRLHQARQGAATPPDPSPPSHAISSEHTVVLSYDDVADPAGEEQLVADRQCAYRLRIREACTFPQAAAQQRIAEIAIAEAARRFSSDTARPLGCRL